MSLWVNGAERAKRPFNIISGAISSAAKAPEKIDDFWEFCPAKPRVREFAQPLIEGMVAHLPEIDDRIRRYCENYEFRPHLGGRSQCPAAGDLRNAFSRRHSAGRFDQRGHRAGENFRRREIRAVL